MPTSSTDCASSTYNDKVRLSIAYLHQVYFGAKEKENTTDCRCSPPRRKTNTGRLDPEAS